MIKEIKLNRITKDINEYLNTLIHHDYSTSKYNDERSEEVYYDKVDGLTVLTIVHNYKQISVKMNKIPHIGEGTEDYKEDIIKKFTKCNYEIRYR